MRARFGKPKAGGLALVQAPLAVVNGYLLVLLASAARRDGCPAPVADEPLNLAVLVPAHDEEDAVGDAVAALRRSRYPADRFEVIVIADNCHDATAARARAEGATVWERVEPQRRGKGHALAWAIARLDAETAPADAVVVVDADCVVAPDMLARLGDRLATGAAAAQADYVVANPDASAGTGLRYAGFALINSVRPRGKESLGLSCGLFGTGMAFDRRLLARVPWEAFSITEDAEYHARLVEAGERVRFVSKAKVASPMPLALRSEEQHARWEGGRWWLLRTWTPRLVRAAVRRRSVACLHQALEPAVPPQSLLLAANGIGALLGFASGSRRARRLGVANALAQAAFVLGGLRLARTPSTVYRALAHTPLLAAMRIGTWVRILAGRGPSDWVRTRREHSRGSSDQRPAIP